MLDLICKIIKYKLKIEEVQRVVVDDITIDYNGWKEFVKRWFAEKYLL